MCTVASPRSENQLPQSTARIFFATAIFAFLVAGSVPAVAQPLQWVQPNVDAPSPRLSLATAYDSARGVTVLFGGFSDSVNGETWEWNGTVWTLRTVSGPLPRYNHSMAYDAARGVTVLFGGYMDHPLYNGETWEWDGTAWTQRQVSGPSPRGETGMVFDLSRSVTVLFGGFVDGVANGETWEWNGSSWTQRLVAGPPPRFNHCMAYDVDRGVTVLFGGSHDPTYDDTWEWNGAVWTQRMVLGPSPRAVAAMAYDTTRQVTILFGGSLNNSQYSSETWEWDGTAWIQRALAGPSPRGYHAMSYDPVRHETMVFGGRYLNTNSPDDFWVLRGTCTSPPFITTQPLSLALCPLEPATFFVTVSGGNGVFNNQWQYRGGPPGSPVWTPVSNGSNGDPNGQFLFRAAGANTASITVDRNQVPSGWPIGAPPYEFRCVISNDCGSITSDAARFAICAADVNCDGLLNSQDFFDFLACFFDPDCPSADFNGSGQANSQDLFDFLDDFFNGC